MKYQTVLLEFADFLGFALIMVGAKFYWDFGFLDWQFWLVTLPLTIAGWEIIKVVAKYQPKRKETSQ